MQSMVVGLVMFFVVTSAGALPVRPYAPWVINCLNNTDSTIIYQNGTFRGVAPSETWSAEVQNSKGLEVSSVRCWCKSDVQYQWDTEEYGPGNGWWTFVKEIDSDGQTCSCPEGQAIRVEMDPHTCGGPEVASGFFHCSGCSGKVSSGSVATAGWICVITGLVAHAVNG